MPAIYIIFRFFALIIIKLSNFENYPQLIQYAALILFEIISTKKYITNTIGLNFI